LLLLIVDCLLLVWGLARDDRVRSEPAPAPLPLGVEQLRLLSELRGREPPPAIPSREGGVCVSARPLALEEDARAVAQRAGSLGLAARPAALELVSGPPDLQVHLPPLPSAEQASRAVREFAALDIEAFVIPDGDLAGGVSLGIFTSEAEAESRRADVAGLGYPVRIVEIPRTRRVWEVLLQGRNADELDAFMLGLADDWPDLASARIPCEVLASAADEQPADAAAAPAGTGRRAPALPRIASPPQGESTPP
jgi:hypothetical protein